MLRQQVWKRAGVKKLELHAVSGSITTRLPATSTSKGNGAQRIEVQGGGVKVYAHSVSGNLSLVS